MRLVRFSVTIVPLDVIPYPRFEGMNCLHHHGKTVSHKGIRYIFNETFLAYFTPLYWKRFILKRWRTSMRLRSITFQKMANFTFMIDIHLFFELYLILCWIIWLSVMLNVTDKTENQSVHWFCNPSFSNSITMNYICIFLNLYIHGLYRQLSFIMSYRRMIRNSTTALHPRITTPWDVWQPSAGSTMPVCVVGFICNLEITCLQIKVKFQDSRCLTGKDIEERSQYHLGIAWREWEKSKRICGKWGSQSLLERIPGT